MYCKSENFTLYHGDNRQILPTLAENSVDAIVTDPPYELGFMGKSWDASGVAFDPATWREALRVLKPGGHLIAFSGSRTYHRMAVAIEDAGFEIRDQIMWIYGRAFLSRTTSQKALITKLMAWNLLKNQQVVSDL
jgi:DNA modification methylase